MLAVDLHSLKAVQLDALREVANMGAGHAATALSTMTGEVIMINVPTITIAQLDELPSQIVAKPEEPVAVVVMDMLGDLTGRTLLVFPEKTALRLAELMLMRPRGTSPTITPLEESAVKEAGNILSAAYMNALAEFMSLTLLPSPPALAVDMARAVVGAAFLHGGAQRDVVFCVESEFQLREDGERLHGYFLLLPDAVSLQRILQVINLA
jgi:chemotaxis protein CheC